MFLLLIVVVVFLVAATLYLPHVSGLTNIEFEKKKKKTPVALAKKYDDDGYVPPDEQLRRDAEIKQKIAGGNPSLKERLNVKQDDVPLKIRLQGESSLRKRSQREKLDLDHNPNNYDYDLDELIRDEIESSAKQQTTDFYLKEDIGLEKEEMV